MAQSRRPHRWLRALALGALIVPAEATGERGPPFSVVYGAAPLGDALVVAGQFEGALRLGKHYFVSRGRAGFLARFDANGRVAWAHAVDDSGSDQVGAVAALDGSDVVIVGNRAGRRVFLARYTARGKRVWQRTLPEGASSVRALAAGAGGDFYIGGCFSGESFDLGVGPMKNAFRPPLRSPPRGAPPLPDSAQTDGFIARLRGDGTPLWSRRVGGPAQDCVGSLAVAPGGALYAGSTVYGRISGEPEVHSTGSHVLVLKLAPDTGSIDWYFTNHDQYIAAGMLFALTADDDAVYFAGRAEQLPDIGSLKSTSNGDASKGDAFAGALASADGSLRWARVIPFRVPYAWLPLTLGAGDRIEIAFRGRSMPLVEQQPGASWLLSLARDNGRQLSLKKLGKMHVRTIGLHPDGRVFWAGAEKGRLARGIALP